MKCRTVGQDFILSGQVENLSYVFVDPSILTGRRRPGRAAYFWPTWNKLRTAGE